MAISQVAKVLDLSWLRHRAGCLDLRIAIAAQERPKIR
jgi:hypothetical protein